MRWLSRDPIEESGGLNLYAFCLNNPLNGVDFLGHAKVDCSNGHCYLKEGTLPKLSYANLPLQKMELYDKVAESLRWTKKNYAESGFRIYSDDSFSGLVFSSASGDSISELIRMMEQELAKYPPNSTRYIERKRFWEERIKGHVDMGGGNSIDLSYKDNQKSHYHSHSVDSNKIPSDGDKKTLNGINLGLNMPIDADRYAILAMPSKRSKCADLVLYSNKGSGGTSLGVTVVYE